jgi:L-alanine-DL-glutamate epimerase-like enolase superfamily enzyme
MKISAVRLFVLEIPDRLGRVNLLEEVPGLLRIQYRHAGKSGGPVRQHFIEVETDSGIIGRCTTNMGIPEAAILRNHVIGEDPLDRERLFQMFHKGTRWVYNHPGWFGDFDNCLWDIAGKAAKLPVCELVGKVRERFPVYVTGGDAPLDDYLRVIEKIRAFGVTAYKVHTYKGGKADIPILEGLREAAGADFALISDPVCSYTLREAIEVGRVMEDLDYVWLEEPMHEQKMHHYQELCDALTIPVMSNETLMHDMGLSAQWLIQGATDRLRGNARNGTTQVLKMAHFAELYGTNIELNGQGGLFGLLHAHLGCSIDNTDYYEYSSSGDGGDGLRKAGEAWGLLNAPLVEDGCLAPPDGDGWGALWDEKRFRSLVVSVDDQ